jgi:hypothetical protein
MNCPNGAEHRSAGTQPTATHAGSVLKCLHSGYLFDGRSCQMRIPAAAAQAAWEASPLNAPGGEGRLFQFQWHGSVWLAYGLPGAGVRGVYCPEHRAQRHVRERHYQPSAPAEKPLAAALAA